MKLRMIAAPALLAALLVSAAAARTGAPARQTRWPVPESPRGKTAAALATVIEAGDGASIRKFFAEAVAPEFRDAFPMEGHVKVFGQLHRALGEFELAGLMPTGPNGARLTLRAKNTGETYRIDYAVEAAPPHRLASTRWEKGATEPPRRLVLVQPSARPPRLRR